MSKMTVNGVSTCKVGQEQYEKFASSYRGSIGNARYMATKTMYQYDYRHPNGELFSTVKHTLEECRAARDKHFGAPQQPTLDASEVEELSSIMGDFR